METIKEIQQKRKRNKEAVQELEFQARYEKALYEIQHYRYLSMKDLIDKENIRELFEKTREDVYNRYAQPESESNEEVPEKINLEN